MADPQQLAAILIRPPSQPGRLVELPGEASLKGMTDLGTHKSSRNKHLSKGRNKIVVEYALPGMASSIGVDEWQTQLTDTLPLELEGSLPTAMLGFRHWVCGIPFWKQHQ